MEETEALLRSYDIPEDIIENFMRNGITIDIFTKLSEAHLQELCPHLGTRIRLSDLITTANVPTATETNASHTVSDRSISKIDDIVIIPTTPPTPSSSANTGNLVITRCFPEFDLKTLLQTSIGGASIIKFYETNHKLNDTKRNQLTDIIIKHIYTHLVHHKITHEEYNILQAKIDTIFPTESPTTYFTRPVGKRDSISVVLRRLYRVRDVVGKRWVQQIIAACDGGRGKDHQLCNMEALVAEKSSRLPYYTFVCDRGRPWKLRSFS